MTGELPGILRELRESFERTARDAVLQVRITDQALQGSPVVVPMTPERARRYRILDPRELLIHPVDWAAVLRELPREADADVVTPSRLYGIPVVTDP